MTELSTAHGKIVIDVEEVKSGIAEANSQLDKLASTASLVSAAVVGAVTAMAGAVAGVAKSSIDAAVSFESAFAGVIKTVDGVVDAGGQLTELGLELQQAFRDLAKEIPITVEELAAIGEIAGQLGVPTEEIIEFTEVIAMLGVTTNLATEEAAVALARLGNVMGSSQDDLTRLASSIVELGNNMATTERDIVAFAERIAGAGSIAGLTEPQVVAIAAAFSSVGIEAEAGGTAVQKVLLAMNTAVLTSNEHLEVFAQTAGMTAEEFATAWEQDAGAAFTAFVNGLSEQGDNAINVLTELELTDQRLVRAFLSLAEAGDLLNNAMALSNAAFEENLALQREAELRFATTESKIQLLKNTFNDLLLVIGLPLLEAFNGVLDVLLAITIAAGNFATAVYSGVPPLEALRNTLEGLGVPEDVIASVEQFVLELWSMIEAGMTFMNNVAIPLGAAILSMVAPIAEAVASFISWQDVLIAIVGVAAAGLIPILGTLISLFVQLSAPILAVVVAIATLRNAWEADFGGIRDFTAGVFEAIQQAFTAFVALFQGDWQGVTKGLAAAWETAWSAILSFAAGIWGKIEAQLTALATNISGWFDGVDWFGLAATAAALIVEGFGQLGATVGQWMGDFLIAVTEWINSVNWFQLGYDIVNFIVTGLAAFAALAATELAAWYSFFVGWSESQDWVSIGTNLVTAILTGLASFVEGVGAALSDWYQAIADWVGGVDWIALGQQIVDGIGEAFNNLGEFSSTYLPQILTAITDWINSVDWFQLGANIVTFIGEGFVTIVEIIAGLGALIIEALGAWYDAFVTWVNSADWLQIGTNLVTAVLNALLSFVEGVYSVLAEWEAAFYTWVGSVDWVDLANQIITAVVEGLLGFVEQVQETLASWYEAILSWATSQDWQAIATQIITFIAEGLVGFVESVGETLASWYEAILSWATSQDWQAIATQIITAVTEGLATFAESVADTLSGWYEAIVQWVESQDWFTAAQGIVERIAEGLAAFAESVGETLASWYEAIAQWAESQDWAAIALSVTAFFAEGLAGFVDEIAITLVSWYEAFVNWAEGQDWQAIATQIIAAVAEGLAAFAESVAETLGNWYDAIVQWVAEQNWVQVGTDIATAISDALATAVDTITQTLGGWYDAILQWAAEQNWEQVGSDITTAVGEALGNSVDTITQTLGGWFEAIAQWAAEADWQQIGADIAAYTIEGLESFAALAEDALTGWTTAFTEWVESVDWYQIGFDVTTFIIEGLDAFNEEVVKPLEEWFQSFDDWATESDWEQVSENVYTSIIDALAGFVDEVASTFEEWYQAFLSWATDTDWESVAQEVYLAIADGLLGFVDEVAGTLAEWYQAFLSWAAETDWETVSQEVYRAVMDGLLGFVDEVASTLVEWYQAFIDWAASADWESVSQEVYRAVMDGLLGFADEVADTLAEWYQAFTNWAAEADWEAVAAIVLVSISIGLDDFWNVVSEVVQGWYQAIFDWAASQPWGSIGGNIVSGIASGISSGIGAVIGAVQQVVQGAIDAANQAAQAESPAKAFIPVGISMSEGIAVGIIDGMGFIVDAMSTTAQGVQTAGVEEFAAVTVAIAAAINEASIAMTTAGSFELEVPLLDLLSRFELIAGIAGQLAAIMAHVAHQFSAEVYEHTLFFVDTLGRLWEAFLQATSAINALTVFQFEAPMWELLNKLHNIAAIISGWSGIMAVLAHQHTVEVYEHTLVFVEALGEFWNALALATEGINALTVFEFEAPMWELLNKLHNIAAIVQELVGIMAHLAHQFEAEVYEHTQLWADTVADVLDVLGEAMENITALTGFEFEAPMWELLNKLHNIAAIVQELVAVMATVASQFSGEVLEHTQVFADAAGALLDIIIPAIDAIQALTDYVSAANLPTAVSEFAADLVTVVETILDALDQSSTITLSGLERAALMAEHIDGIISLVQPAIDAINELSAYVSSSDVAAAAESFAADLIAVVETIITALDESVTLTLGGLAVAAEMASHIEEIVGLVEPAIDAIGALSAYVSDSGVVDAADTFAADLATVVETIVSVFQEVSTLSLAALEQAAIWAGYIEEITAVIQPAIDGIVALSAYVTDVGLAQAAAAFAADLATVVETIVSVFQEVSTLSLAALEHAAEMAGYIEEIIGVVEPALDAINALTGYVHAIGLIGATEAFAGDLILVVETLVTALQEATTLTLDGLAQAAEMAGYIDEIIAIIQPALDAIAALAAYTSDAAIAESAQAFADDLIFILETLLTALEESVVLTAESLAAAAQMFANVEQIIAVIQPALDAIAALAAYTSEADIQEKAQQFADDLFAIVTILVDALLVAAEIMGIDALAAAISIAESALTVAELTTQTMTVMGEMVAAERPDVTPVADYLVEQIPLLANALTNTSATLNGSVVEAALAFRDNVEIVVQAVLDSLASLAELIAADVPGSLQDILDQMIAALENAVDEAAVLGNDFGAAFKDSALVQAEQMLTEWVAFLDELVNQTAARVDEVAAAFAGAADEITAIVAAMWDEILAATNSGVEQMIAAVVSAVDQIVAAFAAGADEIVAIVSQMASEIVAIFSDMASQVVSIVNGMVNDITAAFASGKSEMISLANEAASGIQSAFTSVDWHAVGLSIANGIAAGITAGTPAIKAAAEQAAQAALAAAQEELEAESPSKKFIELGLAMIDGLVIGLSDQDPAVQLILQLVGEIISLMIAMREEVLAIVQSFMAALAEVFAQNKGQIVSLAAELAEAVVSAIGGIDEYSLGAEMVAGIIQALQEGIPAIEKAAKDAAAAALQAAEEELEVASPSQKFLRLGRDVIAGLIRGLSDTFAVEQAIQQLLRMTTDMRFGTPATVLQSSSRTINMYGGQTFSAGGSVFDLFEEIDRQSESIL